MNKTGLTEHAIKLLKLLISTPSFSGDEDGTAIHIEDWFRYYAIDFQRKHNNVYAFNKFFDKNKPTLLLNSHHDTVQPNAGYTLDPFDPKVKDGKLFGVGSNDAGGSLVSLLAAFTYFHSYKNLSHNLVFVASGEEESSGKKGLESVLPLLPPIDVAIVGEPTQMDMAISEKGLVVFDVIIKGTPGHAAHSNDDNPIYKLPKAIDWFEHFQFGRVSKTLGQVKMTVTQVQAGKQHNAIPADVHLVVDVRVNDCYSNEEVVAILKMNAPVSSIEPRSLRLNSSTIPETHKLVISGLALGRKTYGSPTLSDQAVLSCPSLKMGPGDSLRSHSADEFIYIEEIEEGVCGYLGVLEKFLL